MPDVLRDAWDYLASDGTWSGRNGLPALTWAHLRLSALAVLVAGIVAIPPAVVLGHVRRGAFLAVSMVNIGRAVPTFAIIALLFPFSLRWGFGLGFWPTAVALVLLAVPPIFTNTYTGVRDVPADAVEAARGMGMRPGQLIRRVEVPVAWPVILTGLRISSVQVVATATLAAAVGARNLGTPIIIGLSQRNKGALLVAAVLVTLLALALDGGFAIAERRLVRWRPTPGRHDDAPVDTARRAPVAAASRGSP
ncbi:MAG TPA: ABC transporter permease [Acidimicrobiales bacterium]